MCSQELELQKKELANAAENGDIEFLRNCVASNKPNEHYFKLLEGNANIFHIAVCSNQLDFIKEAIKILPFKTIHNLLLDQSNEQEKNPLHFAALTGNIEIVKLMLDVYRLSPPLPDIPERPWLAKDVDGANPCYCAVWLGHEACGLEIWRMDMEDLSDMLKNDGSSLLGLAIKNGFSKMALEMLRSPFRVRCTYIDGFTALHFVAHCSSGSEEEICRRLLERDPEQITQKTIDQCSLLHYWAMQNKLWPFEVLLRSNDIVPNVRKIFVDLMSSNDNIYRWTPLHVLAIQDSPSEENVVEIAKFLIETYKQEVASSQMSKTLEDIMYPWLIKDFAGRTPLFYAIDNKKEKLAMYMLVVDNNTLKLTPNALFLSIEKGCHEVANKILDIVDEKGWIHLLQNQEQVNALHLAPLCKREFCERLLSSHPQLVEKVDKDGATVLHSWVSKDEVWLFEYIFQSLNINRRTQFVKLISMTDFKRNNPFHYVAQSDHEATIQIAKILIESFKQEFPSWIGYSFHMVPWFATNIFQDGPMHLAMSNHREKLALYLLSLLHEPISKLLDYYDPKNKTLFMAIEKGCFQFAREILMKLDKECWFKYCIDSCDGRTILHLAPHCKDQEFIRWLVQEAPLEFISQKDDKGETALDEASNVGDTFTIQAMLQKDPLAFSKVPLAWVKACEKGNISVVRMFINCYNGKFSDHCIRHQDSPLHHIKLRNTTEYEEFLDIPCMKALINVQNFHGETPLHKAIKDRNIFLTEALLSIQKTKCNIKDHENNTAKDLLQQLYQEDNDWKQMCKSIEFDPTIKTTYFQNKANLLDARNTLALVAALLATITFTAGFTVPGGFDQNTGEVMLGKKAAFLVFLLSDTVAMCCSMLILIFLVWSMVYDPNKSLVLIDHSMKLLLISLYSTLLAFMTGVYVVISPKSRWAAILVIVMCSCIGVLANMNWMYRIRDKLFAIAKRDSHKDPLNSLEEGKSRDEHDRLICHDIESSQGRELEEISRAG